MTPTTALNETLLLLSLSLLKLILLMLLRVSLSDGCGEVGKDDDDADTDDDDDDDDDKEAVSPRLSCLIIIREGEAGLFLPQEGKEDRMITTVGSGRLVGELGLIRNEPRALSMVAQSELTCLRIGEEEFLAVVAHIRYWHRQRLRCVSG